MSIPATMKFIVRGKSVDFKNREGSSPSIPKKTISLPNYLADPLSLAVPNSLSFSSFRNGFERKWLSLITSLVIYMIHIEMNIFEQGISSWMIPYQYHYSYWNLQSHLFEDRRNSPALIKFLIYFCPCNWHRPQFSNKMRILHWE